MKERSEGGWEDPPPITSHEFLWGLGLQGRARGGQCVGEIRAEASANLDVDADADEAEVAGVLDEAPRDLLPVHHLRTGGLREKKKQLRI